MKLFTLFALMFSFSAHAVFEDKPGEPAALCDVQVVRLFKSGAKVSKHESRIDISKEGKAPLKKIQTSGPEFIELQTNVSERKFVVDLALKIQDAGKTKVLAKGQARGRVEGPDDHITVANSYPVAENTEVLTIVNNSGERNAIEAAKKGLFPEATIEKVSADCTYVSNKLALRTDKKK